MCIISEGMTIASLPPGLSNAIDAKIKGTHALVCFINGGLPNTASNGKSPEIIFFIDHARKSVGYTSVLILKRSALFLALNASFLSISKAVAAILLGPLILESASKKIPSPQLGSSTFLGLISHIHLVKKTAKSNGV